MVVFSTHWGVILTDVKQMITAWKVQIQQSVYTWIVKSFFVI